MKAIRKEDGKEIDVKFLHPEEYIDSEEDGFGRRIYNRGSLILNEPTDWQAFRREAAKDFIAAMLANVTPSASQWTTEDIVPAALEIADALIRQLKEESK